jgi:hypothetical protein
MEYWSAGVVVCATVAYSAFAIPADAARSRLAMAVELNILPLLQYSSTPRLQFKRF